MPTILFLIDTLQIGGAEKSLLEILSHFKKYKAVICHIYRGELLKPAFEAKGIEVVSLNIHGRYNFTEAAKKLLPVVAQYKPVLIHSTLYKADIIARLLKAKIALPLVNSFVSNSYSKERYHRLNFSTKLKLFSFQLRDIFSAGAVDLFISNSATIKRSNAAALRVPEKKIIVIYRGRSFQKFREPNAAAMQSIVSTYELSGKKVVANVGRLMASKGQLDLLHAVAAVKKNMPDIKLIIAGEGSFRKTLENAITALGIQQEVILLGDYNHIPELLAVSTCFVFPTYYEGLPGALIEAMMAEKPIIASDIPENRECIDERSALFFKAGDRPALAALLQQMLADIITYQSLGKQAGMVSIQKFDIEQIALQYETAYDDLRAKN